MADSCGVRTIKYFLVLFNFLIVIIGGIVSPCSFLIIAYQFKSCGSHNAMGIILVNADV